MTNEQFLKTFQKHLRVAEPRRTEVITEIQQHLSDLEHHQLPASSLGSPWLLAEQMNRTHIGWWGTTIGFYLTPVLGVGLYLILRYAFMFFGQFFPNGVIPDYYFFVYFLRFLPGFISAMMLGQALGRSHRALPSAGLAVIVTGLSLWAWGTFGYRPDIGDQADEIGLFNLMLTFLQLLFLTIVGGFAYFLERPRKKKEPIVV